MTDLSQALRKLIEFDHKHWALARSSSVKSQHDFVDGVEHTHKRLRPVLLALCECAEALGTCAILASTVKQTSEWRKVRDSELDANLMIKTIDRALARLTEAVKECE